MKSRALDAAVIGGGLVGLSSALALQRAGLSTLLIDAEPPEPPASVGNAGHIATEQVQPLANPDAVRSAFGRLFALGGPLDFRLTDIDAWGGWALRYLAASRKEQAEAGALALSALLGEALPAWRRLMAVIDRADLLVEDGHLVVWETSANAKTGRARWTSASMPHARVNDLSESQTAALARALVKPPEYGLAFNGTAQVADPSGVLKAVGAAFEQAGGLRRASSVRAVHVIDGRPNVLLDGETIRPDLVVVAAGVGSGPLMRGLGHTAPVVAERGYHIEGETEGWDGLPPVVFEDRALVATRFGRRLRATSFVEFARTGAPPDPRKWRRLEKHAAELGLPMRGPLSRWMGARPTLPDYLPAIGRSRRAERVIYAFGHQHLGLTLAPLTGELVADLALGRAPPVALTPFELARFDREAA